MAKQDWTPGPWTCDENDFGSLSYGAYVGIDADNKSIAYILTDDRARTLPIEEWRSNARLIAAAPDLYEALRLLRDETADYMRINNLGRPEDKHNIRLADAALAKART